MIRKTAPALLLLLAAWAASAGEMNAKKLQERLIEAHGGMEKWDEAPTMSLEHELVSPQDPEDIWLSIEVTEQGSRRTYQEWPRDEARIAYDGSETWSVNWKRKNPPKFMVNLAYYFLNLPWISADDGVNLAYEGLGRFPTATKDHHKLRMTFDAGVGETPDDYYVIYVDPENHRMAATEFIVTYGAMLDLFRVPPDVSFIGPLFHVYDAYDSVEGLLIPTSYRTYFASEENLYGNHTVRNISFSRVFDESKLSKPANAIVDNSSSARKPVNQSEAEQSR